MVRSWGGEGGGDLWAICKRTQAFGVDPALLLPSFQHWGLFGKKVFTAKTSRALSADMSHFIYSFFFYKKFFFLAAQHVGS